MDGTRKYKYPIWFRFLYLWMPYLIVVVGMLVRLALLGLPIMKRDIIVFAAWLVLLYLCERWIFRLVPTTFHVENGLVSLVRFRRYATLASSQIEAMRTDVITPFGRMTKVHLRPGAPISDFYVAPYAPFYSALMQALTPRGIARGLKRHRVFCWSTTATWLRRVVSIALVVGALILALAAAFDVNITVDQLPIVGIMIVIYMFLLWQFVFRRPVCIEFTDDTVLFTMLFGRRISVNRDDILGRREGLRFGPFRAPANPGFTIELKTGIRLYAEPKFLHFPELASCFRRIDPEAR